MSAELALPGVPSGRPRLHRLDHARLEELRRRTAAGEDMLRAWAATATHAEYGLSSYRGKDAIETRVARRTLQRFLARVSAPELEAARHEVGVRLASAAPKAAATIAGLVEKCDDPKGDTVRLAAARLTLETVGLGRGAPATVLPVALGPLATFVAAQKQRANLYDRPLEVTPCSVVSTEPVSSGSIHNPQERR